MIIKIYSFYTPDFGTVPTAWYYNNHASSLTNKVIPISNIPYSGLQANSTICRLFSNLYIAFQQIVWPLESRSQINSLTNLHFWRLFQPKTIIGWCYCLRFIVQCCVDHCFSFCLFVFLLAIVFSILVRLMTSDQSFVILD